MKNEKMSAPLQVHVCNHNRGDGETDCFNKGSKVLTDDLKKWAKENHKGEIKVYRGGCLGKCENGIAIACYPEQKFLLEATPSDAPEIKEGLIEALTKIKEQL